MLWTGDSLVEPTPRCGRRRPPAGGVPAREGIPAPHQRRRAPRFWL